MTASAYDSEFYRHQSEGSVRSAEQIVPLLIDAIHPQSVVDVGCGVGGWLRAFKDRGVEDVFGVDGGWVDRSALCIPSERFREVNLARPFVIERGFDLALSLEVAEHLPPDAAGDFVKSLTALAPVVAFSAAIPHQGGVNHLNEQWQDYWAALFESRGYQTIDCIRPVVWDNPQVQFWYAQNMLVFVRREDLSRVPSLHAKSNATGLPLRVVHPRKYEQMIDFYTGARQRDKPGKRDAVGQFLGGAFRRLTRLRFS